MTNETATEVQVQENAINRDEFLKIDGAFYIEESWDKEKEAIKEIYYLEYNEEQFPAIDVSGRTLLLSEDDGNVKKFKSALIKKLGFVDALRIFKKVSD